LELNLGATFGKPAAEVLPKLFTSVKELKCLSKLSIMKFRRAYTVQHRKMPYNSEIGILNKLASFVQDVEEEWQVKSSLKETEAFLTYTWKAPAGCTLN
jgi:hypothetical protein